MTQEELLVYGMLKEERVKVLRLMEVLQQTREQNAKLEEQLENCTCGMVVESEETIDD